METDYAAITCQNCYYVLATKEVHIEVAFGVKNNTVIPGETALMTIPGAYRPKQTMSIPVIVGDVSGRGAISTDGALRQYVSSTRIGAYASFSYFL